MSDSLSGRRKRGGGKKFIAGMHMKKGAMTAMAKREGVSNSEFEQEHKHDSGKAGARARWALTMRKFKHGGKKSGR